MVGAENYTSSAWRWRCRHKIYADFIFDKFDLFIGPHVSIIHISHLFPVDVGRVAMAGRYAEIEKMFAMSQLFRKMCFHLPFCAFNLFRINPKPPQASGKTFLRIRGLLCEFA